MDKLKPLDGVRVAEFCQFLAGPYAGLLLKQYGAEVIKVERPRVGDAYRHSGPPFIGDDSVPFVATNRGKRSVELDLSTECGRDVASRLCARSDVVIVSGKPNGLAKLGLDYASVSRVNPNVIYCAVTGYGLEGPKSHLGAMDLVIQGASGLMSITGSPEGGPVRTGIPITDYATGMYAALACTAALRQRDLTGNGSCIDVNLFATAASFGAIPLAQVQVNGEAQERTGNVHPHIAPYQALKTADGLLTIAAASDDAWLKLCQVLGAPGLASDERFTSNERRRKHIEDLVRELESHFAAKPTVEWIEELAAVGIACGPVQSYPNLLEDTSWREHLNLEEIKQGGTSVGLPSLPTHVNGWEAATGPAPRLGADTENVLEELGAGGRFNAWRTQESDA